MITLTAKDYRVEGTASAAPETEKVEQMQQEENMKVAPVQQPKKTKKQK